MKILIAEDDAVSRRMLEETFFRWGYEVVVCSDGSQAWETLERENAPEMAVLDWMMPGVDGPELCRRVRRSPRMQSMYIILLTARKSRDDIIEGLDSGADDYVAKPFDRAELAARVRVGERVAGLLKQRVKHDAA